MDESKDLSLDRDFSSEKMSSDEVERKIIRAAEVIQLLDRRSVSASIDSLTGKIGYTSAMHEFEHQDTVEMAVYLLRLLDSYKIQNEAYLQKVRGVENILDAQPVQSAIVVTYDSSKGKKPELIFAINEDDNSRGQYSYATKKYLGLIIIDINSDKRQDGVSATTSLQHELRHHNLAITDFLLHHALNDRYATVIRESNTKLDSIDKNGEAYDSPHKDLNAVESFEHDVNLYQTALDRPYPQSELGNIFRQLMYLDELHSSYLQLKPDWFRADKKVYSRMGSGKHWEVVGTNPEDQQDAKELASLLQAIYLVKVYLIDKAEAQKVQMDPEQQKKVEKLLSDFDDVFFAVGGIIGVARTVHQTLALSRPLWTNFLQTYPATFKANVNGFTELLATWKDGNAAFESTMKFLTPEHKPFDPNELQEMKRAPERPDKLYRGYTIHPETLTLEKLKEILKPGRHAIDDPTRIGDGNELGVYMSTNSYMVEKVYASGGHVEGLHIPTQRYIDRGGQSSSIELPSCGIVIEVDTQDLSIREPKMSPSLQGHYNNGFQGYEWIADEITPNHYKVTKLILSTHPNDNQRLTIDVSDMNDEELQQAINTIKEAYLKAKDKALKYKAFIDALPFEQRMNEYVLKRLWEKHQQAESKPDTAL